MQVESTRKAFVFISMSKKMKTKKTFSAQFETQTHFEVFAIEASNALMFILQNFSGGMTANL